MIAAASVPAYAAEMTAVPAGEYVLACSLTEGGEVLAAAVWSGDEALGLERLMAALG